MLIQIDGTETPAQMAAIVLAVNALAGKEAATAPQLEKPAGEPAQPNTPTPTPSMFDQEDTPSHDGTTRLDHNGVPFDPAYCGEAAEPFYTSGKNAGQWKKKKGVSPEAYDAWYAAQKVAPGNTVTAAPAADVQSDAAGAFKPAAQQAPQQAPGAPVNAGALMEWQANQQAAGRLNQQQIEGVYQQLGISIGSLFPPTPPEESARHIAAAYGILSQLAAGA